MFTTLNLSARIPVITPTTIETREPIRFSKLRFSYATFYGSTVPWFARAFVIYIGAYPSWAVAISFEFTEHIIATVNNGLS